MLECIIHTDLQERPVHIRRYGPIFPFYNFPGKILIIAAMQYISFFLFYSWGTYVLMLPLECQQQLLSLGVDVWSNFQDDRRNIIAI